MASIVISGDTSGSVTLQAPAVSGSTVLNLPSTSGTIQTSGAGYTTNGVAYATSTSALSTGSALTFDGTNLGVGVTPSASALSSLQVKQGSIANGSNNNTFLLSNAFNGSGGWTYIGSDTASMYQQAAGQHRFFTTASGTAGNAITWTQAMTLDASGNLGIGTSSPAARIEVVAGTGNVATALFRTGDATAANNAGGGFQANSSATAGSRNARLWLDADGANFAGSDYFYIDKTGNSGEVALIQQSNAAMTFQTSGTERARIDSSGKLFVGTTSTVSAFNNKYRQVINPLVNGADQYGLMISANANSYTQYAVVFADTFSETIVGSIRFTTSATSYNTSSDYRLKNTIAPITGALAKVALLKPCTYKWNVDGSNGEGFIAHELAEVVPQCVTGAKDAVDADGKPQYQGIDTSFLVATLTAAIQEQQALITTLTERITALEGV